jgi:hypothetical protein
LRRYDRTDNPTVKVYIPTGLYVVPHHAAKGIIINVLRCRPAIFESLPNSVFFRCQDSFAFMQFSQISVKRYIIQTQRMTAVKAERQGN